MWFKKKAPRHTHQYYVLRIAQKSLAHTRANSVLYGHAWHDPAINSTADPNGRYDHTWVYLQCNTCGDCALRTMEGHWEVAEMTAHFNGRTHPWNT